MPSPLETNKLAVNIAIDILDAYGVEYMLTNYSSDTFLVGAFAPVHDFAVYGDAIVAGTAVPPTSMIAERRRVPIQSCPIIQRWNGCLASGQNYRHHRYGVRLAVHIERRIVEMQCIGDDPDDNSREMWHTVARWAG